MRAYEDTGIDVAEVADLAELAGPTSDGSGRRRPHVVRVRPAGRDWPARDEHDVVVRPAWVHWVLPAGGGGILAAQSRQQRARTRRAARTLADLAMEVHEPVGAAVYGEWSELYAAQVRRMRFGRNLAAIFRHDVL